MHYSIYHYIYFFFLYSFLGWVLEEIYAAFKYGKFVNRGLVNGPVCLKYGACMLIIINDIHDLSAHPVYQFLICVVLVTVIEYVSGALLKKLTGRRFWDYSSHKWNLNGYVSVTSSLVWGLIAAVNVWLIHPLFYIVFEMIPLNIMKGLLLAFIILLFVDLFVTGAALLKWKLQGNIYGNVAQTLEKTKHQIGRGVFFWIQRRVYKAFPEFEEQEKNEAVGFGKPENRVFANGLCFDKLFWIFFISALVGDWIETVFMWVTTGTIMSRSSLLYGTFSIVWGLGGALATGLLYSLKGKNDRYVFLGGFVLGGVYEYSCSVFTEVVFGTTFWDYSHLPFNINGRVNLLFCFFWGVLAIVWVKLLYPAASRLIEKLPPVTGKVLTWLAVLFMALDMLVSSLAIGRYVQRNEGEVSYTAVGAFLDQVYPDEFIERIYPNMKITGHGAAEPPQEEVPEQRNKEKQEETR